MIHATMNDLKTRTQQTYTALMRALNHPGCVQSLPFAKDGAFYAIGEALLDISKSYYASHAVLDRRLAQLDARSRSPEMALYQFYPTLREADLADLRYAPTGTPAYPDEAATLIIGCILGDGKPLRLTGPGIIGTITLSVSRISTDFWALRNAMIQDSVGWHVFLVDGTTVVGLPRTTRVDIG